MNAMEIMAVRMPPDLVKRIEDLARLEQRTTSQMMRVLLERALDAAKTTVRKPVRRAS